MYCFAFTFSSLVPAVGNKKKRKQCANKTHFSALVIIWWDPRHLLYMNYKIYKILNTTFLSLGKLQICHFKMSHNNSYRLYVYKKPFWPLCLLTVFPWPVSFLKLHSFRRKKEKKGGKRKNKEEKYNVQGNGISTVQYYHLSFDENLVSFFISSSQEIF